MILSEETWWFLVNADGNVHGMSRMSALLGMYWRLDMAPMHVYMGC